MYDFSSLKSACADFGPIFEVATAELGLQADVAEASRYRDQSGARWQDQRGLVAMATSV